MIECPELIAQQIGHYADPVERERVTGSIDCGFSIHFNSSGLDLEVVWAKLTDLVDCAAIASKRYFG